MEPVKLERLRPRLPSFPADAARTRETLAEMCVEAPALAKARVIELRAFYTASGNGADAFAAVTAALAAHATPADATALLLGHAPGWEEAVALLTRHRGNVARIRTAQAALLRSEARGWGDALESAWEHRGGVALHKAAAARPRVSETAAAAPPPWKQQPRAGRCAPARRACRTCQAAEAE